jgi:hypothetical protein
VPQKVFLKIILDPFEEQLHLPAALIQMTIVSSDNESLRQGGKLSPLYYDAGGIGGDAAIQFAILKNKPADLTADNFFVVPSCQNNSYLLSVSCRWDTPALVRKITYTQYVD